MLQQEMLTTSIFYFPRYVFKNQFFKGLLKLLIVWQRLNSLPSSLFYTVEERVEKNLLFSRCCEKLSSLVHSLFTEDKILDWTKLKAFADDKFEVTKIILFVHGTVKNTVRKGENIGY